MDAFENDNCRSVSSDPAPSNLDMVKAHRVDTASGPIQPPQIPEYYDYCTSTVTPKDPTDVMASIADFLEEQKGCKFVPKPQTAQIHGLLEHQGRVCNFTVSLYDCSGPNNDTGKSGVLVECSRKAGCSIAFQGLYRDISGLFETRRRGFLRAPPVFALEDEAEQEEEAVDTEFLDSVLDMATSSFYEAKKEGLCTLSFAASDSSNHEYLSSQSNTVTAIERALSSEDLELQRSGSLLLRQMSNVLGDAIQGDLSKCITECLDCAQTDLTSGDDFEYLFRNQIIDNLSPCCC